MAFNDRIRRQLLDGVTFTPKDVPSSAPEHMFVDADLQLRLGIGSDIAHIPVMVNPQMADIPSYNSNLKIWEAISSSQAAVVTGSFLATDWVIADGKASLSITHTLNTQNIQATVFDVATGVPVETFVEVQAYSTTSTKFVIAAGAIFAGQYMITVIKAAGSAISGSGSGSGSGGVLNMGAISGNVNLAWGTNRCIKATLAGDTSFAFDSFGTLAADRVTLTLSQDNTGNRLVTWSGTNIKWSNGFQPDSSMTSGAADLYEFVWDGANFVCINFIPNIA
jgi:hypothetical protein